VEADITTVATVGTAVGTILAVVLALYLQVFLEWRRRPLLSLSLGSNVTGMGLAKETAGETLRVGLRVTAATRRRTAHQVQVIVTANWLHPEARTSIRILDHQSLRWIGSESERGPVTELSLAPGISREVSLAVIGRPLDLYEQVGRSRPTPEAVGVTSAFGVFDVQTRSGAPFELFLQDHLVYRLRIDVTARDLDTVSYEAAFRIDQRWDGTPEPPATDAERNKRGVEINLNWLQWSNLKPDAKTDDVSRPAKLWVGGPPFK